MIVILPTGTGFIVGTAPVGVRLAGKSKKKEDRLTAGLEARRPTIAAQLVKLQRWLRRSGTAA